MFPDFRLDNRVLFRGSSPTLSQSITMSMIFSGSNPCSCSRLSGRASRLRSRSTRTSLILKVNQFFNAPCRLPRWSFPVGLLPLKIRFAVKMPPEKSFSSFIKDNR